MMRHLKRCIHGEEKPLVGPAEGATLMNVLDAIYRSIEAGKSVEVKGIDSSLGATQLAGAEGP
jgi:predicted dehydrogenase